MPLAWLLKIFASLLKVLISRAVSVLRVKGRFCACLIIWVPAEILPKPRHITIDGRT